ncbi:MAG: FecR domain-containing protein [Lacunisphaera sp.]|nr:FecR domain-containing protein [Lacunisphaera sp.]
MKTFPAHPDPDTDEQAALWAARLDGSVLSAADRTALDTWLAADASHRPALSAYCQFSADLEQQLPLLEGIKDGPAGIPPALTTAQPRPWLRWPLMAGAALSAAAAVALVIWLGRPATQFEHLATPAAHRSTLTLADGTRVELNAQTSLAVELDGRERRVRLAAGEAFFTVRKDATRPFTVETPAGSVRVTGTQFNVRTDAAVPLEVTVLEGSVQARPTGANGAAAAPLALAAGDQLAAGTVTHLSVDALNRALAWRAGQCISVDMPLREALARFARYHGRGITATPDAADLLLGGSYSLDDLDGFFSSIEEVLEVKVTRNLNGTVLVSRRGPVSP